MTRYDSFAPFYDRVVGSRDDVGRLLRRLIRRYRPKARRVLELGCGSGTMLHALSRYYKMTGVDNSRGMIAIAKKKAPKASIHLGDITSFKLGERFDAVICPFDTINHVTTFTGWKGVFECAHQHLLPGGVFIFDVNTEHKMEEYRLDAVTADVERDIVSMVQVERIRRFRYDVVLRLFKRKKGSMFELHEMRLPELVVPTPKILKELSKYFGSVTLVDPDRGRPTPETEELFFVCQRPR